MPAGDETILGPYDSSTTGVTAAGAAMGAAYVGANDQYITIPGANNMQFWIIHIEGA
jgi:hypothetical protein